MKMADENIPHSSSRARRGSRGTLRDRVVITATILGVIAFLVFGGSFVRRNGGLDQSLLQSIQNASLDPDRGAVRQWIAANLSDPHPVELEWWPARRLVEFHKQQLEAARMYMNRDPDTERMIDEFEQAGPDAVCRMRFQTVDPRGRETVRDELFVIRRGKARLLSKTGAEGRAAAKLFLDAAPEPPAKPTRLQRPE